MFTEEELIKLNHVKESREESLYSMDKYDTLMTKILHEIRNPLTLIKSTIQLIETKYPETKEIKYWDQLTEDLNGCIELISEFNRLGNSLLVSVNNQNLLFLIKNVVNSFLPQAEQNNIDLSIHISNEAKPYFSYYPFDKIKLKQVLINLIKNAFEATKDGDYIKIECNVSDSNLIIAIHDNGKVIPKEDLATIFDLFVTNKAFGTGLGLPISRNIISAHNGTLEVSSEEEKTSFIISLPLP
jgi:signal transduction histidine kinase